MDVLSLVDFLIFDDSYECQDPILNINGDEFVNVVDVIALVQSILGGDNYRIGMGGAAVSSSNTGSSKSSIS